MLDENEVRLRGHLGKDAEVSFSREGTCFANLVVATNRRWKDAAGEPKEETTWHNVVVIGKQAEFIRSREIKKGARVEVRGYIRVRSWVGKDELKKYKTEVVALQFTDMSEAPRSQPDGYAEEF